MKTIHPDDQAFPFAGVGDFSNTLGLTKREYFAAMALQGILSHRTHGNFINVELSAVDFADGLINALNRDTSNV